MFILINKTIIGGIIYNVSPTSHVDPSEPAIPLPAALKTTALLHRA